MDFFVYGLGHEFEGIILVNSVLDVRA